MGRKNRNRKKKKKKLRWRSKKASHGKLPAMGRTG